MAKRANAAEAVAQHESGACEEAYGGKRLFGVRVDLSRASEPLLRELLHGAWRGKAPRRLVGCALIVIGLGLAWAPASAAAADVWVDASAPAGGDGSMAAPLVELQAGLDAAMPGDTVRVLPGTYASVQTVRDGSRGDRIHVVSETPGEAIVQADGTALAIDHASHTFEGLVFDCGFGSGDCIRGGGGDLELLGVEVRNATQDCIDLRNTTGVLVESSSIHHCIAMFDPDGNADAHGITGDSVFDLTVVDSDIHLVTGDAIQLSPAREPWGNLHVEGTSLWSGPLDRAVNGWEAGQPIGENAFDSKVGSDGDGTGQNPRAVFVDVEVWGWRGVISNQGAFNVKETVDFTIDRASIRDSELAFRLREPATVRIQNVVVWDVDKAMRIESGLPAPVVLNATIGGEIAVSVVQEVDGGAAGGDFRNVLVLADELPALFSDPSNLAVDASAFVDAAGHDYHLVMDGPPVDAGVEIAEVEVDRDGVARPVGAGYDVGAFEWTDAPPPSDTGGTEAGDETAGPAGEDASGSADDSGGRASASAGSASADGTDGEGTDGATGSTEGAGAGSEDGGCACRSSSRATAQWSWLGLLVAAVARRRRSRSVARRR